MYVPTVTEDLEDEQDAYVQDYMYSESTVAPARKESAADKVSNDSGELFNFDDEESVENLMRDSMKQREKDFYGDDSDYETPKSAR